MTARSRSSARAVLLLGLGVILFAVGAKMALIARAGTDQPYADQWAVEGMYTLRGMLYYPLDFNQVFAAHGEHRPALARLLARGLILANHGQWDCFVELVADLLIFGGFVTAAWCRLAPLFEGPWLAATAILMALLFALPCAYENYLWGFQSAFLLLFPLGMMHLGGTLAATRPGIGWSLAQVAGLLGLFSIAAGSTSAAALVVVAGIEFFRGRRDSWVWATLGVNAVLFGFGLWLLPEAAARPGSWFTLLANTAHSEACLLSWPRTGAWWCLLFQLPWLATFVLWIKERKPEAGDRLLAALGLWIVLAAATIAYGRGVNSDNIGNRYYDVLIVGVLLNGLALLRFISRQTRGVRRIWVGIALAWTLAMGTGLWRENNPATLGSFFKFQKDLAEEQARIVREFMQTKDPAALTEFAQRTGRFPHLAITLVFLRDEKVYPLLPPSLNPAGVEGPLSRWARRIAPLWPGLLGAGLLLLALGAAAVGRETPPASARPAG